MWRKKVAILSVALLVFFVVPVSQGVPVRNSPELYSLYIDWLQGKPVGLVTFSIEPYFEGKPFTGELIVSVIDYNSQEPKVIMVRRIKGTTSISLKIERIPVGVQETLQYVNGTYKPVKRTVFKERKYFVSIIGVYDNTLYSWGRFVVFEPQHPMTKLHLSAHLHKKIINGEHLEKIKNSNSRIISELRGKGITLKQSDGILYSTTSIDSDTDTKLLPAGVIHAAPWTKVEWHLGDGIETPKPTGLWYDSFYQDVPYLQDPDPNGWKKGGKAIAIANTNDYVTLDNSNMWYYAERDVKAHVQYRIDAYYIGPPDWPVIEYVITPQYILDVVGGYISSDAVPAPPSYAGTIHNSPQTINFIVNTYGPSWKVQSVTFTFGLDAEIITADVSVTLYRAAGDSDAMPPYIKVYGANGAKYWYKNNDRTSYEVYFHW